MTTPVLVFASGVHSGPNPSPGVGTARAIRDFFPDARITGVDYSPRSTGLQDRVFDATWVVRPWHELDLDLYAEQIKGRLADGALWISGLDVETTWLAQVFGQDPTAYGVLIPNSRALMMTAKPAIRAARHLGYRVPAAVPGNLDSLAIHEFCRRHGWRVWVKGTRYEAVHASSWTEVTHARSALATRWGSTPFVQENVEGDEESIAYAAFQGRLIEAVRMVKTQVTQEGKTWAGALCELEPKDLRSLERTVRALSWTGGGEIECVRTSSGEKWVIDWNPRFPAWVHGAEPAGFNLPASLVAAGRRQPWMPGPGGRAGSFVRVVSELPATDLHQVSAPSGAAAASSKHPSGMPALAHRLVTNQRRHSKAAADTLVQHDLRALIVGATPERALLSMTAAVRIASAISLTERVSKAARVETQAAYSIKTDPDPRLLTSAKDAGLLAEAISQKEAGCALVLGWPKSSIVLNGPGKWWPTEDQVVGPDDVAVWFADSVEELDAVCIRTPMQRPGIRIRPLEISSRFGIDVSDPRVYRRLVRVLRSHRHTRDLAVHFHHAASDIGPVRWERAARSVVEWASALEADTGRRVTLLDVGGGWFPDEFEVIAEGAIVKVLNAASSTLPALARAIIEPGKAVTQSSKALIVSVLEVRKRGRPREVVVDGSIADLPQAASFPHRIYRSSAGSWLPLPDGEDRVLGRICMEHDVLAWGVSLPNDLRVGERLAIVDSGAYDQTMSYQFGVGIHG